MDRHLKNLAESISPTISDLITTIEDLECKVEDLEIEINNLSQLNKENENYIKQLEEKIKN